MNVVHAGSGETAYTLRGPEQLYGARATSTAAALDARAPLVDVDTGRARWHVPVESFDVLHGAVGPGVVAFAEAAGAVRCFDDDGRERRRCTRPEQSHVLRLTWSAARSTCVGLLFAHEPKTRGSLLVFDPAGGAEVTADAGSTIEAEFLADDEGARGAVLRVPDGELEWQLLPPVPLVQAGA